VTRPDDRPTFLLGVGCQKGGTAWLHRYLAASPECDPGFRKEYHVWDTLDLPDMAHFRTRLGRRVRRAGDQVAKGRAADADTLRLATFLSEPEAYYDYFELLLRRPGIRLTADITPAYAGLSVERLAAIRDGFERRGIRVAPVFLMREPTERIWSVVRMYQQRNPERFPGRSEERVERVFDKPRIESQTRYEQTMARVEEVFGPEGACYALFEELFEPATVDRICGFLGIRSPGQRLAEGAGRRAAGAGHPAGGRALPGHLRRRGGPLRTGRGPAALALVAAARLVSRRHLTMPS